MTRFISVLLLTVILFGCHHDQYVVPQEGIITFSLSRVSKNGGRIKETATPVFVLLKIEDSQGNAHESIKLPLVAFGQSYLSEDYQLQVGEYHLASFVVLDASNTTIYATPLKGSPLARYVTDPLPLSFTVTSGETTQVIPEVLAVTDQDSPELFGYTSFGFKVIAVMALEIPLAGAEKIVKVSCEFSHETETIKVDRIPLNGIVDLNDLNLLGKTWQSKITVWLEAGPCYQKLYRLNNDITFNGTIEKLPAFTSESWGSVYYAENNLSKVFYSTGPTGNYHIEIEPLFTPNRIPTVDRGFWTEAGDPLKCPLGDDQFVQLNFIQNSDGIYEADFQGLPVLADYPVGCDMSDKSYVIDSQIIGSTSNSDVFEVNYFVWRVTNGIAEPFCPGESGNGRISGSHHIRK